MEENIVIVESPAKAKTIKKFLGNDFMVTSSYGHIRDLNKKNLGIEIENGFKPDYIVPDDKKKVVSELKKMVKQAKTVWLASDEDREGEAIAWHLSEVLKLKPGNTKRIVFHEITKDAIQNAVKKPREIDENLVNAQQARRILDRLVGFELSPVLWRKVQPSLSAGRVQSVAVRLLVDREREIMAFKAESAFRVTALFKVKDKDGFEKEFQAELPKRIKTLKATEEFLKKCIDADFSVKDIVTKPAKKTPSPPFTTSTLQQEASRKLGFSVSQTMTVAQRLYEAGHITYMRTDSVNLAQSAVQAAQNIILETFGAEFAQTRAYKTKAKGAQEAHEAIRPTYLDKQSISGNNSEQKLYNLIWKRTIASQMSDAQLEKTTVKIDNSKHADDFVATGEVLKFEGFLKVYIESTDNDQEEEQKGLLPVLSVKQELKNKLIEATERFTHHPPRYTEASLVKKLEELGIGRPSTYAPVISTIQQRNYVIKEDRPGTERTYNYLSLTGQKLNKETKKEVFGKEKAKLFPNDIGIIVNDFLVDNFKEIMDYNFTAKVEKQFDEIAQGKDEWTKMIETFYGPFHKKVENTLENSEKSKGEKLLGTDPASKKNVYVKIGRYGPIAQIGERTDEEKPKFASLLKGQHIETIKLEEALELFKLPRTVGMYENKEINAAIGRFGPYVKHDNKFYSLKKDVDDPMTVNLERAIELIEEKRERDRKRVIKTFKEDEDLRVLNGRWGPYIAHGKKNYKIPKNAKPENLSYEDCMELIKNSKSKKTK